MVFKEYPKDIKGLMDVWTPYGPQIFEGVVENVPVEALDAYKKCQTWFLEQGQ